MVRNAPIYGTTILVGGTASNVKCAIAQMKAKPRVVVWNIPRTAQPYISYRGMEEVKDGCFFSGKYKSGMVDMSPPHVICFANFAPEEQTMSNDRWKINYLGK